MKKRGRQPETTVGPTSWTDKFPWEYSILDAYIDLTIPDLSPAPAPAPPRSFTTSELRTATGITAREVGTWIATDILRPSVCRGSQGAGNTHRFSGRDILVAAAITCLPTSASDERRRLSAALYDATHLRRYVLVSKATARLFDSLRNFDDPVEWTHHLIWILDLRMLHEDIRRRAKQYALKSAAKTETILERLEEL